MKSPARPVAHKSKIATLKLEDDMPAHNNITRGLQKLKDALQKILSISMVLGLCTSRQ